MKLLPQFSPKAERQKGERSCSYTPLLLNLPLRSSHHDMLKFCPPRTHNSLHESRCFLVVSKPSDSSIGSYTYGGGAGRSRFNISRPRRIKCKGCQKSKALLHNRKEVSATIGTIPWPTPSTAIRFLSLLAPGNYKFMGHDLVPALHLHPHLIVTHTLKHIYVS